MLNTHPARPLPAVVIALLSAAALAGPVGTGGVATRPVPRPVTVPATPAASAAPSRPAAAPGPAATPGPAMIPGPAMVPGLAPPAGSAEAPIAGDSPAIAGNPPPADPGPAPPPAGPSWAVNPSPAWPPYLPSPEAGRAGVAADGAELGQDRYPSPTGSPAGAPAGLPAGRPPAAAWPAGNRQRAAAPVTGGMPPGLPQALIYSGLASLIVAGTGLLVVARLRRQW